MGSEERKLALRTAASQGWASIAGAAADPAANSETILMWTTFARACTPRSVRLVREWTSAVLALAPAWRSDAALIAASCANPNNSSENVPENQVAVRVCVL